MLTIYVSSTLVLHLRLQQLNISTIGILGTRNKMSTTNGISVVNGGASNDLEYAEKLNSDPNRLKFAYVFLASGQCKANT
jgi:hypothetical protein